MESNFGVTDPALLDKIDKLFACSVGDHIDLPQLVVVGDQSSGKSSVLEGFTKLPFPRDSTLCTRHATQITFRRSQVPSLNISIVPSPHASEAHRDAVRAWSKQDLSALDSGNFAAIMKEVEEVMGLGSLETHGDAAKKTFSEDCLRLEISGPDQEHFSVIDVPGIFKRTTSGLTTKQDIETVKNMVRRYMENPRSVILTVVPANVDIATQEILEMAEEIDPEGIRTLGVLTKPDLVDKGAETAVIEMINGRRHSLRLGWHLLRNPGQAELQSLGHDRDISERKFFQAHPPWNGLEKEKIGILALRGRLQEILTGHIRREFPKVKQEISKKLKECTKTLDALGAKRQTTSEQMKYLMDIATEFQRLTLQALASNYSRTRLFEERQDLRLPTIVLNRSDAFAMTIGKRGHTHHFESSATENSLDHMLAQTSLDTKDIRTTDNIDELEDIMHQCDKVDDPNGDSIMEWLEQLYGTSRGFEMGTFNTSLLAVAMREQAQKWEDIALSYVSDVVIMTHSFVTGLLDALCPVQRVRDGIQSLMSEPLLDKYGKAMSHTRFLLKVELDGTPATLNHYFNENLQKCRAERYRSRLSPKSFSDCQHGTVVRLDDITKDDPMSNAEHTVQDIHDILKSYYQVALKRFVDSVRMQAADHYLLTGSDTPLTLFSPQFVADLSAEQLEQVAGEDAVLKRRRAVLEIERRDLEEGKRLLVG